VATGIPELATRIREQTTAAVFLYSYDRLIPGLNSQIDQRGVPSPLVLVGHSYGAATILQWLSDFGNRFRLVDLIVTIDPYPHSITIVNGLWKRAINHFTLNPDPNGPREIHGVALSLASNTEYTTLRHSCSSVGQNHTFIHTNIDDCDLVKDRVLNAVFQVTPR